MQVDLFSAAQQLYPTPFALAGEMFQHIQAHFKGEYRKSELDIFDPSAGKGDLLDYAAKVWQVPAHKLYCCEIDPDLRFTLQGKGYRYLDGDFLSSSMSGLFNAVVMNPPFANGAEHVLKAWGHVKDGGILVALLNADNFNAPRGAVAELELLIKRFGETHDMGQPFTNGQRRTNVNVAMIVLAKPKVAEYHFSTDKFKLDPDQAEEFSQSASLVSSNQITALVARYKAAEAALLERYHAQKRLDALLKGVADPIFDQQSIQLNSGDYRYGSSEDSCLKQPIGLNAQLKALKSRFWRTVIDEIDALKNATTKFTRDWQTFQVQQSNIAFTEANIRELISLFIGTRTQVMQDALISAFEQLTKYHAGNTITHLGGGNYSGWKHNLCWKLSGKKMVIPYATHYTKSTTSGYLFESWTLRSGETLDLLHDLDKIGRWLRPSTPDDALTLVRAIEGYIKKPKEHVMHTWVESEFFEVQLYKGTSTMHLRFKDPDLLRDFNLKVNEAMGNRLGDGVGVGK